VLPYAGAVALVAALVALAAAQPLLLVGRRHYVRADAEIYAVLDTSRSMLAASSSGGRTRFQRARADAERLRATFPDVRFGVASLTDRLVPHLFPTSSQAAFGATLERAVGVDRPPPRDTRVRATSFAALADAPTWNFFSEDARRRLLVVFTDGEGQSNDPSALRFALQDEPVVQILFVQVWNDGEHVYDRNGREEAYTPDPGSGELLDAVAAAGNGEVFSEGDRSGLDASIRERLGTSSKRTAAAVAERPRPLAAWAIGAAFVPLLFLLWRRNRA
jgi:hypothetical protein